LDQILGGRRWLRLGIELGLEVIERGLERQPHMHAAALTFRLAQRLLQLFCCIALEFQKRLG
jgi:hypothetical protein